MEQTQIIFQEPNPKRRRKSRRITLRKQQQNYIQQLKSLRILHTTPAIRRDHFLHCSQRTIIQHCIQKYNYVANPNKTHWVNCRNALGNTLAHTFFNSITNLTFHNLCVKFSPPSGTKQLLGLGHKFIPLRAYPSLNLHETFDSFARDVRLKYAFAGTISDPLSKNQKKIYTHSDWIPDRGSDELESRLSAFQQNLIHATNVQYQKNSTKYNFNLNRLQYKTLLEIKNNPDIIVLLADKNLGPVVMDRETYIQRILSDHLLDKNTYQQLDQQRALQLLHEIRDQLIHTFENPFATTQNALTSLEKKYFRHHLHTSRQRIPTFYGLAKIHKTPWTLRPVVSCCGSLLAAISTWIDFHLQKLRPHLPAFIQDSQSFQTNLSTIKIPRNAQMFTSDATSMYTNIDVGHSIEILGLWFDEYKNELPPNLPCNLILSALRIVMENNIFSFGDTFWIQQTGTAMGTPCACMIASVYFAYHERKVLLPKYDKNIIFYKRFIDDIFCIWRPTHRNNLDPTDTTQFDSFKNDLNTFGKLKWKTEQLSTSTTFLDLDITLIEKDPSLRTPDDFFVTKFATYQKPMNLYLYIPPTSAHPPGITTSLIYSQLRKYWFQNTDSADFVNITREFFQRLATRGHNPNKLAVAFHKAAQKIDLIPNNTSTTPQPSPDTCNEIFLKWKYHPHDVKRNFIRHVYNETCENYTPENPNGFRNLLTDTGARMQITKLTVAYQRDKNLRDMLIPSRLRNFPQYRVSHFLHSEKGNNSDTSTHLG